MYNLISLYTVCNCTVVTNVQDIQIIQRRRKIVWQCMAGNVFLFAVVTTQTQESQNANKIRKHD